jgi:hypothetical protein
MCLYADVKGNWGTAAALLPFLLSACITSGTVALNMPRAGACRPDSNTISPYPLCLHEELTLRALSDVFSPDALEIIVDSNRSMDGPISGLDPLNHFDNGQIEASVVRMRERYQRIRETADPVEALELFGKIIHAAQDFISHSNYVEIMVEIQRGAGAPLAAPPALSIVAIFEEPQAELMAGAFAVPEAYLPLLRKAVESGRLTSGHICLLDYPLDVLGKIPLIGDVTNLARDLISVPGTILSVIPVVGDATTYVLPVFKSHYNLSKDEDDLPSARVRFEDGRTVYDLCLETAAAQTRHEYDRHFAKAIRRNRALRGIDWRHWQNPKKSQAGR